MSTGTAIEWTEATWNPVTGCDRVSPGCDNCYAATLAKRLKAMGNPRYQNDGARKTSGPGFGVTLHHDQLELPFRWKKSRVVFVNSMSDLFHPDVPNDFICDVFSVMALAYQHTFQVLTKRPRRMAGLLNDGKFNYEVGCRISEYIDRHDLYRAPLGRYAWDVLKLGDEIDDTIELPLPNVWLGTSVEDQKWADQRIPQLLETPATVRFLSCEPLLESVDISSWLGGNVERSVAVREHDRGTSAPPNGGHQGPRADLIGIGSVGSRSSAIHWVIVGGESGPVHRPFNIEWARSLRDQCLEARVPYFFKQVGGRTPKAGGRNLDGRTWDEMPEVIAP